MRWVCSILQAQVDHLATPGFVQLCEGGFLFICKRSAKCFGAEGLDESGRAARVLGGAARKLFRARAIFGKAVAHVFRHTSIITRQRLRDAKRAGVVVEPEGRGIGGKHGGDVNAFAQQRRQCVGVLTMRQPCEPRFVRHGRTAHGLVGRIVRHPTIILSHPSNRTAGRRKRKSGEARTRTSWFPLTVLAPTKKDAAKSCPVECNGSVTTATRNPGTLYQNRPNFPATTHFRLLPEKMAAPTRNPGLWRACPLGRRAKATTPRQSPHQTATSNLQATLHSHAGHCVA